MNKITVSGFLRCFRYEPRHRGKNSLACLMLDVIAPKPARISFWTISAPDHHIWKIERMPKGWEPLEDEWVTVSGVDDRWGNNLGSTIKRVKLL